MKFGPSCNLRYFSILVLCPEGGALSDDARLTSVYMSRTSGLCREHTVA